jgi:hypothetical protein
VDEPIFKPPIICLGFGEFDRKCTNKAEGVSGLYCQRCEELQKKYCDLYCDSITAFAFLESPS